MLELVRKSRNEAMLAQCHPIAAARFRLVITALEGERFRPRIQQAWRSPEEQAEAHASDHSDVSWSLHQASSSTGKPEALAVDLLDDDAPIHPTMRYMILLGFFARQHTCRTGILWRMRERRADCDAAVARGDITYAGPIGFDPCHLEVADVTYPDAHRGLRPAPAGV